MKTTILQALLRQRVLGCFVLVLSMMSTCAVLTCAGQQTTVVPTMVKFSGKLADGGGRPITEVAGVTFALYKDEKSGVPLWLETQNVQPDSSGNYAVVLGSTTSEGIPSDLFADGEARWLGVQVEGQKEQPRIMLLSVPYALKAKDAETVGGLPATAFALAGRSVLSATAAGAVSNASPISALAGTGTTDYLPLWTSSTGLGNSALFQSGTGSTAKVGIGTTSPASTLDVKGSGTVRGLLSLPAAGAATSTVGQNSQAEDFVASSYSSSSHAAVNQTFQWRAEPAGNNTGSPSGTLNLLFASGTGAPAETGVKVGSNGTFTFASSQTFTGSGAGLTNIPAAKLTGTIADTNLPSDVARLAVANAFTNAQSVSYSSSSGYAVRINNANSSGGGGLSSTGGYYGVSGFGSNSAGTGVAGYGGGAKGFGVFGNNYYNGGVGVEGSTPFGGTGVYGNTSTGVGVYGTSSGSGGYGLYGNATNASSTGVYAHGGTYGVFAATGSGIGVYGTGGTGVYGYGSPGVHGQNGTSGGHGVEGADYSGSGSGVYGSGGNYGVYGSAANGTNATGVYGTSSDYLGVGVAGVTANAGGYGVLGLNTATGVSGGGIAWAVFGKSYDGVGVYGTGGSFGVISEGNFAATGTKSAVVALPDDRAVLLYAVESPENWFEDFGSGQLTNGVARIELDPVFAQTVTPEAGYHVYLTPNGDCEGLYVAQKSATGFEVRELRKGTSNVAFDYRIVARRKGLESVRMEQVSSDHETAANIRQEIAGRASHPPRLLLRKAVVPQERPQAAPGPASLTKIPAAPPPIQLSQAPGVGNR